MGSAAINTTKQVGGAIGTALLNTLGASAATAYLVGRQLSPVSLATASLHSYATAFLWSSLIFAVGAAATGLVLSPGTLEELTRQVGTTMTRPSAQMQTCGFLSAMSSTVTRETGD